MPILAAKATWAGSHVSSVADLTFEMCVPSERWTPVVVVVVVVVKVCFFREERVIIQVSALFALSVSGSRKEEEERRKRQKEKERRKRKGKKLAGTVEADKDAEVDARPGGPPAAALGAAAVGVELEEGSEGTAVGLGLGARDRGLFGHDGACSFLSFSFSFFPKRGGRGRGAKKNRWARMEKRFDGGGRNEKPRPFLERLCCVFLSVPARNRGSTGSVRSREREERRER